MSKQKEKDESKEEMNENINEEQELNNEVPIEYDTSNQLENLEDKVKALEQELNQYKELTLRKAEKF